MGVCDFTTNKERSMTGGRIAVRRRVALAAMVCGAMLCGTGGAFAADPWVTVEGKAGPGLGKKIVLVSGDDEYRSEEALPQLAKILATRHGFTCTVLFAVDAKTGEVVPTHQENIPGLEALRTADVLVMLTRFRNLPDEQMKEFDDYLASGRPIIGMRTATHAFNLKGGPYKKYSFNHKGDGWDGGFGRRIFGETWISHHGKHKGESTRGIVEPGQENHPLVRGLTPGSVWGPTDVYGVRLPLPEGCEIVLRGAVLTGMKPTDPPVDGPKNSPLMPIAWTKTYPAAGDKVGKVFTTTMGSSTDLENDGFRRLMVNSVYWAAGLEDKITADLNIELVGKFIASPYGFGSHRKGLKPQDYFAD